MSTLYPWYGLGIDKPNELHGGESPALRIARYVLEHYPAFVVVHHLELLRVAPQMRSRPKARLLLIQNGTLNVSVTR